MSTISSLTRASGLQLIAAFAQANQPQSGVSPASLQKASPANSPTQTSAEGAYGPEVAATSLLSISSKSITSALLLQGSLGADATMASGIASGLQQRVANNEMSSQDISNALYSGSGQMPGGGPDSTIQGIINSGYALGQFELSQAQHILDYINAGRPAGDYEGLSASYLQNETNTQLELTANEEIIHGNAENWLMAQLSSAFSMHTLTIQKATDVAGLNYQETDATTYNNETETASMTQSWNTNMISDNYFVNSGLLLGKDVSGKNATLVNAGGVELYVTW